MVYLGLCHFTHRFANLEPYPCKIGRIAGASASPLPEAQPPALLFCSLPIRERPQDCKGMLPIGTPCKPMLPNLNGWVPAAPQIGANGRCSLQTYASNRANL